MVSNKALIYKKLPTHNPLVGEHIQVEPQPDFDLSQHVPSGSAIIKGLYFSCDPYMRGRMRAPTRTSYSPPFEIGKPINAYALVQVLRLADGEDSVTTPTGVTYGKGDILYGLFDIAEYSLVGKEWLQHPYVNKVENPHNLPLSNFLSVMGMTGLTAYSSLYEIGQPKKGETIFISSAAGAVGQIVGQIAKREGLRVIGSVGDDAKLDFIVNELGFDGGFNYKKENSALEALQRLAPDGVDIYYENVGGEQLSAAIECMNVFGRIVASGMVSQYSVPPENRYGIKNLTHIVPKRIRFQGFLVNDADFGPKYVKERNERVPQWLVEGSIKTKEHIDNGIDSAGTAFVNMLEGKNFGKAIIHIADPDMPSAPRRFSYASVVSGAANDQPDPSSSAVFSRHLNLHIPHYTEDSAATIHTTSTTAATTSLPSTTSPHTSHTTTISNRNSTSVTATDADMQMNYGATSAGWRRSSGLPPYSRQFANIPEYAGGAAASPGAGGGGASTGAGTGLPAATSSPALLMSSSSTSSPSSPFYDSSFFVPSYLRNSRYVARLEAARRSKLAAAQREPLHQQQQQPSLSASSSHVNLHRMAPSHRGMTYDIVEKEPAITTSAAAALEDKPQPLPSRWNESDRHDGLDLTNDGLEVRYMGHVHKPDHEAASIRADFPMPRESGIYYYEATILVKPKDAVIAIGFSSSRASLERLPGWDNESWAYHGDDGKAFVGENQGQGRPYGPTYGVNDTIGCGVNFTTRSGFFTKNGILIGPAFKDLPVSKSIAFYPSIGMKRHNGMHVRVNFGQQPFMYDIDGMVKTEKHALLTEISETSTANLQPPLDEAALLQELVAQFLAQEGYYETARTFAEEVREESVTLEKGQSRSLYQHEPGEDIDTANRQKIRAAILEGDMDKALKYTNAYFPKVLQDNPHILFKLRCRKFLEMMCKCSDSSSAATTEAKREEEMEVDDGFSDGEGMDTEEPRTVVDDTAKFHELLTEAVQYGQQLRMDYPSDEYGGDKQYLEDIFSLVAYPDPRSSVHGHHLDASGRVAVADDLNAAILVSLGKSSTAALEILYSQTEVLVNELSEDGGTGAFINIRSDFMP